jgi:hypothetical protein
VVVSVTTLPAMVAAVTRHGSGHGPLRLGLDTALASTIEPAVWDGKGAGMRSQCTTFSTVQVSRYLR